jgi:hypothetical protein
MKDFVDMGIENENGSVRYVPWWILNLFMIAYNDSL